ncbi:MAG TPA: hypothetical protein DCG53_12815 [Syntrophus sp. (in: bacteria)]|jgi:imidazolonepropionase-like amidohydrolase|nr:hypothetical protein [Syntrophus sp. (in: bacteria)]
MLYTTAARRGNKNRVMEEVLRCATINNAKILRREDKIGTIDKGKIADMVVFT